jgi:hypothetical protein
MAISTAPPTSPNALPASRDAPRGRTVAVRARHPTRPPVLRGRHDFPEISGRISAIGTHDELLRISDIYRETYTSQNKQSHDDKMAAIALDGEAAGEEVEA